MRSFLDARQRDHAAAGPGQIAAFGRGQQQPHVAIAAATLVERLEAPFEGRRAGDALAFELGHACFRCR